MAIRPNQYAKLVVSLVKALSREIKMNEEEKNKSSNNNHTAKLQAICERRDELPSKFSRRFAVVSFCCVMLCNSTRNMHYIVHN